MKIIPISGVIGLDVSPGDIRAALVDAGDIDIEISSPGGLIFPALEIFNLLRNHRGKVTAHVLGICASAASYIAMAASHVRGERGTIWAIHNAQGFAAGDHNAMRKTAGIFEGMSRLLAREYVAKTKKTDAEIRAAMDKETWLFGAEARDYGLVDEIVGPESDGDREAKVAEARLAVAACAKTVADLETESDIAKAVALIETIKPGVAGTAAADQAAHIHEEGQRMTLDQLKKEHPEVYAAAKMEIEAAAEDRGVNRERSRVNSLRRWNKPACADIVSGAIVSGATEGDVLPQLMAAMGPQANDTPPPVNPKKPDNGAGAEGEALTEEKVVAEMHALLGKKGGK
ncbi:MAG TPA: head maturation protease, ClpP-related [Coriobacteriia bacterium]|nr:head maturation protease, ClpP-related [Coriobacteriia bacterium]